MGGTFAQVWTSLDSLKRTAHYRGAAERSEEFAAFANMTTILDGRQLSDYANKFKQQWWTTHDPGLTPDHTWTSLDYDDSGWQTTTCPSNLWQYVGFADFEGMIWYRRTVLVPDDWQGKDLLFSFSGYSQEASFYCNGVNIDTKHLRQYPDQFTIPAAQVKPGKNVFAVRVIGVNGGGGITGDPKDMYLAQADNTDAHISLAGPWAYRIGLSLKDIGAFPITYTAELPGTCFNAMIHPLAPFALTGVLWYQGESDMTGGTHQYYREVLRALIDEWRDVFGQKDLPFLIVQLPNIGAPNPRETRVGNYARVREAQLAVALATPHTGLVTTIDIGEPDIHPRNKQDVGKRLALLAQGMIYGKRIECRGPLYAGMTIEGNAIRLHFTHTAGGLMTRNGEAVQGFAIAGDDGNYALADAVLAGDDVIVSSPRVNKPTVVRYAMWDNPTVNLYNKAGLPATPFRTDCADTIASTPVASATK